MGLFLLCCYLATFPGAIGPHVSDDRSMYLVTQALADRHDVALVDPREPSIAHGWQPSAAPTPGRCVTEPAVLGVGRPGTRGGPVFSKYGLGQPLLALPLYVLGTHAAALAVPADRPEIGPLVTSMYNPLVTALTAVLLCALAMRLGYGSRVALALPLIFGLATPAWPYTTTFFSEPSIALSLLGALASLTWRVRVDGRMALLAGVWLGIAVLVRTDSAVYLLPSCLYLLVRTPPDRRLRVLGVFACAPLLALLAIGAYNLARFGSPTMSGYGIVGDTHDLHPPHTLKGLWEGIYGPLLSPGKGLLLYAPALLLLPWAVRPFARAHGRPALWLALGLAGVDVLAHADTLIIWLGGWAWGPRFMIPLIPVLLVVAGAALHASGRWLRRAAVTLAVLGVAIQIPAVLLDKGAYISYLATQPVSRGCIWQTEDLYKWHPQYSPLIGQWQRLLDPRTYAGQSTALHGTQVAAHLPSAQWAFAEGRYRPAPQAWWQMRALQGAPAGSIIVPLAGLGVLALLLLTLALRGIGPPEADTTPELSYRD